MDEKCTWTENDDGAYETGCGGIFVIMEGTPTENEMRYCPYCGKKILEEVE